jgi:hypothetical protein
MPLCSTNEILPIILRVDQDKPPETRPQFHGRFLTAREQSDIKELVKQAGVADADQAPDLMEKAIRIGVTGWSNLTFRGETIGPDQSLRHFLTNSELGELLAAVIRVPHEEEERRREVAAKAVAAAEPKTSVDAAGEK